MQNVDTTLKSEPVACLYLLPPKTLKRESQWFRKGISANCWSKWVHIFAGNEGGRGEENVMKNDL